MGRTTKIDWCDASFNPVTGCRHGCKYCYARGIATRFGTMPDDGRLHDLNVPIDEKPVNGVYVKGPKQPYPYCFAPTFHRYKLDEPQKWKKPKTIFVCSMADLFGEWVPDEWIKSVFDACDAAPQHRYLFLTKNPKRYIELADKDMLPRKHWYGYSATRQDQLWTFHHADDCPCIHLFVSIEPILEPMQPGFCSHVPADWVIIGAETGSRAKKVVPKKEWIMNIAEECEYSGTPVFMKESLREIVGNDFRQEVPWKDPTTF